MKNVGSAEANVALVREVYAAFGRGDIATVLAHCAPDIDWDSIGPRKDFPLFGPRHGRSEVEGFFREIPRLYQFTEFAPREFMASGETVVALGHYAFTVHHNGHKVATDWAHVFTIRDGKVARFREHTDSAQFVEAYRRTAGATERNKAVIRRWIEEGWNRRNLALVDELYAPDVRQHDPNGLPVESAAALKEFVAGFLAAFPDIWFTVESLVADGDRVTCRFAGRGTHRGGLMGIAATGRTGAVTGQLEFRFDDDKIVEVWVNYDLYGLLRQLGAVPAPA
jgi:steroid delta-isomerase-like uncharacterized protein